MAFPSIPWQHLRANAGLLAGLMLVIAGCDTHVARVTPAAAQVIPPEQSADLAFTILMVGSQREDNPTKEVVLRSPMPLDAPISCIRRDGEGVLWRAEDRATTGTPWWQRFPADLISDALPWQFTVEVRKTVVVTRLEGVDRATFLAEARQAGYATLPPTPKGKHP